MALDAQKKEFIVGQKVARAAKMFRVDGLYVEVVDVTKIVGDKIYLANSPQPLRFPNRVVIIGD